LYFPMSRRDLIVIEAAGDRKDLSGEGDGVKAMGLEPTDLLTARPVWFVWSSWVRRVFAGQVRRARDE
jgi:hypothetical protein